MSVNRRELIEADSDEGVDLAALHAEITAGRESARTEPLLDDADVARDIEARLSRKA